jgi:hypothetical protein
MRSLLSVFALGLLASFAAAQDEGPALAAKLHEAVQDNASSVRLKLEFTSQAGEKVVLQLQAKARRTAAAIAAVGRGAQQLDIRPPGERAGKFQGQVAVAPAAARLRRQSHRGLPPPAQQARRGHGKRSEQFRRRRHRSRW